MSWTADLKAAAGAHGVAERAAGLSRFVELFVRWNQKINLSAARTPEDVTLQVVDCLALLPYLKGASRLVDVGSGGGLPGLVLALTVPGLHVRSIEPVNKKAAFQSSAVRELKLDVDVAARRVDPSVDSGFDVAVSRATFDLLEWLELGATLVHPGGLVLGMEGRDQRPLPEGATRHAYDHGDRTRAVISLPVPS